MADRHPVSQQTSHAAGFSDYGIERDSQLNENVPQLARDHAVGRNRRVAQLLCYLSLMRSAGIIGRTASVRCVGAVVQDDPNVYLRTLPDGDRARREDYQDAHYLPGHIQLAGADVWASIQHPGTRLAIATLFSRTHPLPADFNKADSYVERYARPLGLKRIFADVCRDVVGDPAPSSGNRVHRAIVNAAYMNWVQRSAAAYLDAATRKQAIGQTQHVPDGTLRAQLIDGVLEPRLAQPAVRRAALEQPVRRGANGNVTARAENYSAQASILNHYRNATLESNLSPLLVDDVERSFQV